METQPAILIVEDDDFISTYLEDKLSETFRVFRAPSADKAREILASQQIDLIVLDVLLPQEDGFTFLENLKKSAGRGHDVPVLIVSNLSEPHNIERGKKLGAADYLVKANQLPADVVKRIKEILGVA